MTGRRSLAVLLCSVAAAVVLAPAAWAQTRTEVLRWSDGENEPGELVGYRIHFGPASRDYDTTRDVPLPSSGGDVIEAPVQVPAGADVYFAVTAVSADSESLYSNEICRGPDGSCASGGTPSDPVPDPDPDPDPPGSTSRAAIDGFALWDAETDTVIDRNFENGGVIDIDVHGDCVAIEILGNAYLEDGGPGSVRKVFDDQGSGSCDVPGETHENGAPFAWPFDEGPDRFGCTNDLSATGAHRLTVTPYDGDDCTGAQGESVTLEFTVRGFSAPPEPEPLGQPGKPQVVD